MNPFRLMLILTAAAATVVTPLSMSAADTTVPPTVVPQDRDDRHLQRDLRGVPDNIKTLITTFDQTRDKYLNQQQLLLVKLHRASTAEEREQVRQQIQANRQDFLAELKGFREDLRNDLQAL